MKQKTIITLIVGVGLAVFTLVPTLVHAGVLGSKHDFSGEGWSGGEACIACHTPHNSIKKGPTWMPMGTVPMLWNHRLPKPPHSFSLYDSATMDGSVYQPTSGPSKLCLSCHDGVIAVDSLGDGMWFDPGGSYYITGPANLTTNLKDDHPINFYYNTSLAQRDGDLKDPATAPSGLGGTIEQDMLHMGGMVQCNSCHDPHDTTGNDKMLLIDNADSALCLTCHKMDGS